MRVYIGVLIGFVVYSFIMAKKRGVAANIRRNIYFYSGLGLCILINFIGIKVKVPENPGACEKRRMDAYLQLNVIHSLQMRYFTKYNQFAQNFKDLGFNPKYSSDLDRYKYYLNDKDKESDFNINTLDIDKDGFIAIAIAKKFKGDCDDILIIDKNRKIVLIQNACDCVDEYFIISKCSPSVKKVILLFLLLIGLFYIIEPIVIERLYLENKNN
ncbi:MAG: hypothetical protein ACMUJM_18270 [bacterium]